MDAEEDLLMGWGTGDEDQQVSIEDFLAAEELDFTRMKQKLSLGHLGKGRW